MTHIFYPTYPGNQGQAHRAVVFVIFWLILAAIFTLGLSSIGLNHPFSLLDIESRALYVDEGFYADAAQNFVKFGQWDMPLDSRHWPGAPFVAVLQSAVFSLFGVSLTSARLLSILLSLISIAALYSMSRTKFTPLLSLAIALSGLLTFNYIGFSRAAIADPTASSLSMLALWAFVRIRVKPLAIVLSFLFAYLAFFSKMYFLFTLITIVFLWTAELFFLPLFLSQSFDRRAIMAYFLSAFALGLSYWAYQNMYHQEIANFLHINSNKKPHLDWIYLKNTFDDAIEKMPYHTKSPYMLGSLILTLVYFFISRLWPPTFINLLKDSRKLYRVDWAMGAFFACGFVVVGSLYLHKAHYHYFTILPVVFLSVSGLSLIFSGRVRIFLIGLLLSMHLLHQVPYYKAWMGRPLLTSIDAASHEMANRIERERDQDLIPVIGEYSAQLALYSDHIMSLDAKWISQKTLCERVEHWRPAYHVNVVWPASGSRMEREMIVKCDIVSAYEELDRFSTFKAWQDEIVLSRIIYK